MGDLPLSSQEIAKVAKEICEGLALANLKVSIALHY